MAGSIGRIASSDTITSRFAQIRQAQDRSMRRIASGKRVNSAADDAAAVATIQQFLAIEASAAQGQANLADGQAVARVAEGSLSQSSDILIRMRELGIQANNGTLSDADRKVIQQEYDQLAAEVTRISASTEFNGKNLLNGDLSGMSLHDGQSESLVLSAGDHSAAALGIGGLDIADPTTLQKLDGAMSQIVDTRASLGAADNRLSHQIRSLGNTAENAAASRSRIGDADLAFEIAELAKNSILQRGTLFVAAHAQRASGALIDLLM